VLISLVSFIWSHVAHKNALAAQHNRLGNLCCDGSDVIRLSNNQWRIAGDHYEVNFRGKCEEVPNNHLTQEPGNRFPEALLILARPAAVLQACDGY
jgi:hypothetical protein